MTWTDHGTPRADESAVSEPLETVLAASRSVEEEALDLMPVEVAVAVKCSKDRHVSLCQTNYSRRIRVSGSESEFEIGPSRRRNGPN